MIDEVEIKHKWKHGTWHRKQGDRYLTKEDVCELCTCIRTSVKFFIKDTDHPNVFVSSYERSGQIFPSENMPQCWGSKNPE